MRKRYRVLLLAAIGAALIVPVGFALSLESASFTTAVHTSTSTAAVASPILAGTNHAVDASIHPFLSDGVKLLLVGTTLFGLAAFLRRSA